MAGTVHHDALPDVPAPQEQHRLEGHGGVLARILEDHQAGRLHHALMLAGERGIGKATLAFAAARAIQGRTDPDAAARIAAGTHPNVHHVTRSQNDKGVFRTGIVIDDIHRMSRFLSHTSGAGRDRTVIIDSVGDMNAPAANALLKNLEEPPKNTYFFVINHTGEPVLPTIRSRCRFERLAPLTDGQVAALLEATGVDPDEARRAASEAAGSVREAHLQVRFGGAEFTGALNDLGSSPAFKPSVALALADAVSARDSEQHYDLLMAMVEKRLADAATRAARAGRGEAAAIAQMRADTAAQRMVAEGYGLDRRLEVLNLLRRVHPFLAT
jgi:DNA polymerase-3 subunit delta'